MRRVIHKLFWIWQLDKEEDWINEMARHGYSLVHTGKLLNYEYEETEADLYKYRTLFLKGSYNSRKNQDYLRFLEEMGIKTVTHCGYPGTCCVYVRGLSSDFPDGLEIYSDIESRIGALKVMTGYMFLVIAMCLFCSYINYWSAFLPRNNISWLNLVLAVGMTVLFIAAVVATIKMFIQISKLKKERAIHE